MIHLLFSSWDREPSPVPVVFAVFFVGRGTVPCPTGREAGKSKKQGAGKIIPRALVVDLIGLFIVGQGTVPCPKREKQKERRGE